MCMFSCGNIFINREIYNSRETTLVSKLVRAISIKYYTYMYKDSFNNNIIIELQWWWWREGDSVCEPRWRCLSGSGSGKECHENRSERR